MARDDYSVLVYKILVYYYACMKRKIIFDQNVYDKVIGKEKLNDGYLENVYCMMQDEGLIKGFAYTKAWGETKIIISDEANISITAAGIRYIENSKKTNKVKRFLLGSVDYLAELIRILGL